MVNNNRDSQKPTEFDDAVARGQELAEENHAKEQAHMEESREEGQGASKPIEGKVPEDARELNTDKSDEETATTTQAKRSNKR